MLKIIDAIKIIKPETEFITEETTLREDLQFSDDDVFKLAEILENDFGRYRFSDLCTPDVKNWKTISDVITDYQILQDEG